MKAESTPQVPLEVPLIEIAGFVLPLATRLVAAVVLVKRES